MLINIVIVGLIGLIAYWWANQGFLSGLLHLVCVITAGAMALAWWEPITVDYLLSKSWWSGLMPGAAMLLTFIVTLVILRLAADKLAFANTRLPRPIDMVGGGVLGAASGVLTVGLLMLGVGFIDQPQAILGYTGWTRNQEGLVAAPEQRLWLPVDAWVVRFYETLSVGVLHPDLGGRPLAEWNPYLDRQASLRRPDGPAKVERRDRIGRFDDGVAERLPGVDVGGQGREEGHLTVGKESWAFGDRDDSEGSHTNPWQPGGEGQKADIERREAANHRSGHGQGGQHG